MKFFGHVMSLMLLSVSNDSNIVTNGTFPFSGPDDQKEMEHDLLVMLCHQH